MAEILKDTFKFFRLYLWQIFFLTFLIEIPFILINNFDEFFDVPSFLSLWFSLIMIGFLFVVYPFSEGAQISLYAMIVKGFKREEISLNTCLSNSKKYLPELIISSFIYIILTGLGLLALILPGIIIGVRLSFYGFLIINDGYKPIDALKKSYQITKEFTWKIANPLLVVSIGLFAFEYLIIKILESLGIYNFIFSTILDIGFSVAGWLILILIFRFYCLYKDNRLDKLTTG